MFIMFPDFNLASDHSYIEQTTNENDKWLAHCGATGAMHNRRPAE